MGYISTIKTAVQLFPFLAFLLTLPYMILNYRKYGSVNKLRVLIFYSFMLYLMTVYLLVILPLPDPSKIHTSYSEMVNLHPFAFVVDFFKESPFDLAQIHPKRNQHQDIKGRHIKSWMLKSLNPSTSLR